MAHPKGVLISQVSLYTYCKSIKINCCIFLVQGAVSIIFRGKQDQQKKHEADYIDKFANPFPAAVRGESRAQTYDRLRGT
jgi:hypothetical protein